MNSHYENLIRGLVKYGGTVTRYTGDGVLALFGAPLDDPDHALHAVQVVWEAYSLLAKFKVRRSVDTFELQTGFGIHTGMAVVGSISTDARAEYTPIGVADHVICGQQAEVSVKGRSRLVWVVEVVGMRKPPQEKR
ncbi:MAG: adenylate/guanylate cyclase domain-containing protein [Anaerolineae bacterium]|nr:adenylate/guanylate cyclase domain-containing protein [Anaerolineae bacterium]